MKLRFFIILISSFWISGNAFGQDIKVEMGPDDKGKPLPTTSIGKDKLKAGIWVAHEGFQLKKSPIINSEPSGYKALQYMEHFDVSYVYQGEDQTYYLLSRGRAEDFKNFGWVPEKFTCFSDGQTTANNIYKKALIVNSLDQITKQRKVEPIPLRLAPTLETPVIDPLRLYNIYSVYSDTNPKDPTKGYCLLGSDYGFTPDDNSKNNPKVPAETVKGWVSKENLCFWDTREALEWDANSTKTSKGDFRRTTPTKVFHTREDAMKEARSEPVTPWFIENFDKNGESIPMQHYSQRYPRIPMKKEEEISLPEFGKLIKIGSIGGFVDENGNEIATKDELEKLRKKMDDLQFEVESTDLVFIIDDTESMNEYFKAAAECAEKVLEAVKKEKGKVRIGLVFYNDIPFADREDPKNLEKAIDITSPLVDITSAEGQKIIQKLKDHKTTRGGDPREQMFHGLKRALETVGFSRQSRKIAILIGDTGDHDTNATGNFEKEVSIMDRMVFEDRSPIEFFGIQVIPPKENPDFISFKSQIQKIIELTHAKMASLKSFDADGKETGSQKDGRENLYIQISDVDELIAKILNRYKVLRDKAEATASEIAKIKGGQWTRVSPEVERILKQENVDLDKLRKTKGLQVFDYGWVWEKGKPSKCGCNQVRMKMLTEEYDRLLLARLLEDIENANPGRKPSPENIAKILNNAGTGEKDKEIKTDNLSDHRLKSNGLFARSPLLSKALGEIKDDESFQSELNKLFMKRRLLEDIGKNEKSEFVPGFEDLGDGTKIPVIKRIGEPKKEPRMFRPNGSTILTTKWVWLDFEEEWP